MDADGKLYAEPLSELEKFAANTKASGFELRYQI
jgi:hypothetical protein